VAFKPNGTKVQHLTHNPKIKGLNPTTGTEREKKGKKVTFKAVSAPVTQW
jgi:hypothetical protein